MRLRTMPSLTKSDTSRSELKSAGFSSFTATSKSGCPSRLSLHCTTFANAPSPSVLTCNERKLPSGTAVDQFEECALEGYVRIRLPLPHELAVHHFCRRSVVQHSHLEGTETFVTVAKQHDIGFGLFCGLRLKIVQ